MFLSSRCIAAAVLSPACLIVVIVLTAVTCHSGEIEPNERFSGWSFDPGSDCESQQRVPQGHTFQLADCQESAFTDRIKSIHRRSSWKRNTSHCGRMYCDNPVYFLPNFGYYETNWRPAFVLCHEPGGPFIEHIEPQQQFETPPLRVPAPAPEPDEYSPPANDPAATPTVVPEGHSTAQ